MNRIFRKKTSEQRFLLTKDPDFYSLANGINIIIIMIFVDAMNRFKPIHVNIRDDLLSRIKSGEYGPGDCLPTENDLMKSFQASRSPVRQALDILRMEGFIYRHPGRGTFVSLNVRGAGPWALGSIQDIIGLGSHTRFQLHDFTPGQISEELNKIFKVKKGKFDRIQGVRFLKDKPLYYLIVFLPHHIGKKLHIDDISESPVIVALERKLNIRLKKCIQNISAALADATLARVLEIPNQSAVLCIDRLYSTENEEIVEWARSFYRPDLFQYRSELSRG